MLRFTAFVIAGICLAPLILVLASWVVPTDAGMIQAWQHLQQTQLGLYLGTTFALSLGVALLSASAGVIAAWLVTRYDFPGRTLLEWALILPLAMPAYVSAYSYGSLLEYAGPVQALLREVMGWSRDDYWFPPIRSLGGAIWIMGFAGVPYVFLLARAAFLSQPREWAEAAATLGAYGGRFFLTIAVPAARPFIATGVALALMESLADIGTVTVLGIPTLSAGIYRVWFFMQEPLVAARLGSILLLAVLVLMALEYKGRLFIRYNSLRQYSGHSRYRLSGWYGISALLACLIPVLAGFILPLGVLIRLFLHSDMAQLPDSLGLIINNTLMLGMVAGGVACVAAFVIVSAEHFHAGWMHIISLMANLGYAIPGAVLAVGLMLLFGWLRDLSSYTPMLTGSMAGLVIAYVVRFMATAYSPLYSGVQRIAPEMDMVSTSLGKSRLQTMLRIHLPLLLMPMCVSFLMVFIDTIKELPATLILRPFDVKTLAVAAHEFASDDRLVQSSPFALCLVVIATISVLCLHKLQQRMLWWHHVEH